MHKSTIDLHNFKDDIYTGFIAQDPLEEINPEVSFFGGKAFWLHEPNKQSLKCSNCPETNLTFLGQIYCPLNADFCYHRILYLVYCQRCLREFKCIRQQSPSDHDLTKSKSIKDNLRKVSENSYEIETDILPIKSLNRIVAKAKRELEEEQIIEEEVEKQEENEQEEELKEFESKIKPEMIEEGEMEEIEENFKNMMSEQPKEGRDDKFEEYKKVMAEINGPVMLYTNQPIPYNSLPLNPRHQCKYCGNPLSLELQITEKVLLLESTNPDSKLLLLDWGSMMIYTCVGSCKEGSEECVVAQYELQAIKEEEVKKLKKKKKNKKKKESKERSRSKKEKEELMEKKEEEDNDWD